MRECARYVVGVGWGTPGFAEPTAPPLIPETQRNADREYRRVSRLIPEPLPPGRAYPPALPDRMIPASSDGVMEQGLGRYVAWYTWLCAWESAYLTASASDDKPALAAAEAKLNQWPSMEFHRDDEDDPDHVWTTNVLDKMNLDDPSGVKSDYDSLCSDFPTVAAK